MGHGLKSSVTKRIRGGVSDDVYLITYLIHQRIVGMVYHESLNDLFYLFQYHIVSMHHDVTISYYSHIHNMHFYHIHLEYIYLKTNVNHFLFCVSCDTRCTRTTTSQCSCFESGNWQRWCYSCSFNVVSRRK